MKACSLTATDEDGDEATLMFTLSVMVDPMPTFGDTSVDTLAYTRKQEIESLFLIFAAGFGSTG